MRIIIIGGSGFLSGTLARTAVQDGHQVSVITRGQRPVPDGVSGITADRRDAATFAAAITSTQRDQGVPWDLVIDCIGYEAEDARQDIAVFRNLAHHFVFVSTDFVYDPARRQFPQSEGNEHFLTDDSYGAKKRRCELEFINDDTGDMAWSIIRPCHIYGPGSQLGCLPAHSRDPDLIRRLRAGEVLQLVGGGHFLQQPILASDLAAMILSCAGKPQTRGQLYQAAGPNIIESREYYRLIAALLGVEPHIEELPVAAYLKEHPEHKPFLCHRIYDLSKLHAHGLAVPGTPVEEGLRQHVASLSG
ncbi:MAG TPA: NAD-dependent epimerase/dehydratase family protein [Abditibacteriaceae bacterium]|nr:NAD-dependent epimerase/dehydratase family protein [Abditibacteriaceae bacterium]